MADDTKPDFAIDAVVRSHPAHCTRHPKCTAISRSTVARAWRLHRDAILKDRYRPSSAVHFVSDDVNLRLRDFPAHVGDPLVCLAPLSRNRLRCSPA